MTKEILVSISGLQMSMDSETDTVELIAPGEYYYRNDKHFVLYDEAVDGQIESIKNIVKMSPECVEVTKKGPASIHMVFEKNKKNVTYYYTPFGSLNIGIDTHKIDLIETDNNIRAEVDYALDINYEHVANCHIVIDVKEKGNKSFKLIN